MPDGLDDDVPEEPDEGLPPRRPADPGEAADELAHLVGEHVDVYVPDGTPAADALARTTDLGIGAHPDDLELLMVVPIGTCRAHDDRWFTGVTATDGAGSVKSGPFAGLADDELVAVRRAEQHAAAHVGSYGAVLQLGHRSADVRGPAGADRLVDDLESVLRATRPVNVYTHDLADRHATHAAVALATVRAIRRLPMADRPWRLVGVEGWRDLDWLDDAEKVHLDASPHAALARELAACFPSQLDGKRYDVAAEGRRRAHATFRAPRQSDTAEQVALAMDLTPLVRNDDIDPIAFLVAAIDRFRDSATAVLRASAGAT